MGSSENNMIPCPFYAEWLNAKEIDILGSHLGPYCYDAVIQEIAKGSIPTEGLITHQFPLEQWEKAFEIAEKDTSAIKVALIP